MACPAARLSKREARGPGGGARGRRRRRAGQKSRALPARLGLCFGAARVGLGAPAPKRRTVLGKRACGAVGVSGSADRRADIHQRLGEIARSLARRQHARRPLDFASCSGDRLFERHEAREDAGDVAVDRRGLAPEGDSRNCRGGVGADAGKGAQFGLLARKQPAAPRDLLGAGVQVPRPGIIAEAGERADHGFDLGGGQIFHPRPVGDEGPIVGAAPEPWSAAAALRTARHGKGRGLARRRAPDERAAMAVPPPERSRDDRLSLCLPSSALTLALMQPTSRPQPLRSDSRR